MVWYSSYDCEGNWFRFLLISCSCSLSPKSTTSEFGRFKFFSMFSSTVLPKKMFTLDNRFFEKVHLGPEHSRFQTRCPISVLQVFFFWAWRSWLGFLDCESNVYQWLKIKGIDFTRGGGAHFILEFSICLWM
eukprot:Lithocolla_globosa_v1_NODE_2408_length_2019_cov_4.801935.p2 type:complete len:132 gc:universal NODE_2408_length_2019_cov_4.801935:405-10(-)